MRTLLATLTLTMLLPAIHAGLDENLRDRVDRGIDRQWIRWSVETPPMDGVVGCSWSSEHGRYSERLRFDGERESRDLVVSRADDEPSGVLWIYAGYQRGRLHTVRAFDGGCMPREDGTRVDELNDVPAAESIDWLSGAFEDEELARRSRDQIMMAVAHHRTSAADRVLARWARGDEGKQSEQAVFWLGQARGDSGVRELDRLIEDGASADLRAHMTFAYSISRSPDGLDRLFRMARRDSSSRVRSQALFWIAQHAGEKAAGEIERAIEEDPDLEVKEHAVFALSQMKNGVPELIRLAQTHEHPEIRKKAMFWLGQSDSDEALEFFESILDR